MMKGKLIKPGKKQTARKFPSANGYYFLAITGDDESCYLFFHVEINF